MGSAINALFYLRITSLKNAVISRFRRLKQPKYLIGAVVGSLYIYFTLFRRVGTNRGTGTGALGPGALVDAFPVERLALATTLGASLLMIFVALYWLWPRSRAALTFSEAEIAFLFPAPIGRRTLIHYRWINAQLRLLFTSLILALVSGNWGFVPGNAAMRLLGWWLIFSTLDLHAVGSSFAITRLLDRGVTSLRRRLLTFGVVAVVIAAASMGTWRALQAPTSADLVSVTTLANYVGALLSTGPLSWLLAPARWVAHPLLAPDLRTFLLALGPALLVYAAHYVWVLRSEVSFEEASIAKAEKRAARRNAATPAERWRIGRGAPKARRAPFKVSSVPRPELAFLWKNLLSSAEYFQPRTALIAAAIIVVGCSWLARTDLDVLRTVVVGFAAAGAGYTLFFGPMLARQDLRSDLSNADILKTYPLHGWQIVLGEILAPVAIVTVLLWLLLLAGSLAFQPPAGSTMPGVRAAAAIAIALLAPLLCAIQVLVMNSAAVLFPAWMQTRARRESGIDVLGQGIFLMAALFLVVFVALLPAAIGGAAAFFAALWILGVPVATALAIVMILLVLSIEVAIGIWWLGKRFEAFDLSAELRP